MRGAVLADGPGLAGGGPAPGSPSLTRTTSHAKARRTRSRLSELTRDVRPPDYAATYVRQALQFSGLDVPVVVSAIVRPPWLAAVADESGVASRPIADALRFFEDGNR